MYNTWTRGCRGKEWKVVPVLRDFFTNMSAPMPLQRKLYLVLRNNWIKARHRQACCGHPGEPGC